MNGSIMVFVFLYNSTNSGKSSREFQMIHNKISLNKFKFVWHKLKWVKETLKFRRKKNNQPT